MIIIWIVMAIVLLFGFVVFFGAPYVPVKIKDVRLAFDELYVINSKDLLIDLGSGDGKVLREAAKRGARAIGYELNPALVAISNLLSRKYPKATTKLANLWLTKFPDQTTLIYIFINSRDTKRLVKKILKEATRLQKPLYVLSYGFDLPDLEMVRRNNLHKLYIAKPLQVEKAQV